MQEKNRDDYRDEDFEVKIVQSWDRDEIVALYTAAGWWKDSYESSGVDDIVKNSYAFAVAINSKENKAVGMARVISDGVSDAYIQDTVILPQFRRFGLGKRLVRTLVDFCKSKKIFWIGLIAEPGSDQFYQTLGFQPMKDHIPMRLRVDKDK